MGMGMMNVLALARWHRVRSIGDLFQGDNLTWLLIGLLVVIVLVWALKRRRRRWF